MNGKEYIYSIKEPVVHNSYTSVVTGSNYEFTVTNTYHNINEIEAKKYWYGVNGSSEKPHIWFTLYRKTDTGTDEVVPKLKPSKVDPGNDSVHWQNPKLKDDEGRPYSFYVKETDKDGNDFVPEGFEKEENGLYVYNYKGSKKISFTVEKDWTNVPDQFKTDINVQLKRDGSDFGEIVLLNKDNNWTYSWTELDKYKNAKEMFDYTVEEDISNLHEYVSYESTEYTEYDVESKDKTGIIKNKFTIPTEDVIATKVWDENNPAEVSKPGIKFELWRKGGTAGEGKLVVEATALTDKKVDFGKQDKTDINGVVYEYYVKEIFENPGDVLNENWIVKEEGLKVTNTVNSPEGKLTIKKVLKNEPQNSSFSLYGNNDPIAFGFKVTGPYGYEETFTLIAGQSITLENLYYGDYKVEETEAHGYTASYDPKQNVSITKSANEATVTVTNSNTGGDATTVSKTITKVWENGPKPGATLELWRKGQALDGAAIDEKVGESFNATANELTETYSGLAKHDPSGREFEYYVKEDTVPENYTASINQETLTVTNTYTIPTKDVIATKVWDENNPEEVSKPGIKFELWRKGGTAGEGELVVAATALTEDRVNFGSQYKTDINGVEYEYYVKEIYNDPNDPLLENWSKKEEGLKVTNSVNEPEGKLTIKKVITPKSAETSRKFKVRITGPYGYEKVIEIASGKSVELKELYYGKYTVTEINPDGFEPQYSAREVILRKNNPKAEITITNKKIEDPTYPIWPIWPVDPTTPELNKRDHFGYVIGYPQGDFRPENTITRAEMTAIFARLLEEKIFLTKDYPIPYNDVSRNAWYAEYVRMLTQFGVISGYPDGSFRPENPVTRAEFATVASRFIASKKTVFGGFTDIASEYWAKESIQAAYAEGWLKGYPDGSFRPERELTRAEAVTIINRMLDRVADRDYVDINVKKIVNYTDLTKAHWAYYDIMEASNSHDYVRLNNRAERWTRHWRPY